PASSQVVERGVEGAAVGAVIGGIVGGGRGAATGAAIGGGAWWGGAPGAIRGGRGITVRRRPTIMAHRLLTITDHRSPSVSLRRLFRFTSSHYVLAPAMYGHQVTGLTLQMVITACPAPGCSHPLWVCCGPPGYSGFEGTRYIWHAGYWGPHVGYYGGIDYGFGYSGAGYEGGYWNNGVFFYNTAVTRVDTTIISNTYNKTVVNTVTVNNVSFNGPGGAKAQPTAQELAWSHDHPTPPTKLQVQHQKGASANRALLAPVNHGAPAVTATAKPGAFESPAVPGPKGPKGVNKTLVTGAPSQTGPGAPE